jgi:hypothetical protein
VLLRRFLVFAGQFADTGVSAPERLVLHQSRLNQGVDRMWGAREAGSDDAFGFGIPRC